VIQNKGFCRVHSPERVVWLFVRPHNFVGATRCGVAKKKNYPTDAPQLSYTMTDYDFDDGHTYDDIQRAYAADPHSVNWNDGCLAQLVLGKHDIQSFQFLLDCAEFEWYYATTDVSRSCVNVTGKWSDECETCKKGRASRLSKQDDRWLQESFQFHYDVFCRVIESDRLLQFPRLVNDMMFILARYTTVLAPIVYARLQPRHWINMMNAYNPPECIVSHIKHYTPNIIDDDRSFDREATVWFVDSYPWSIEPHTCQMLNPIVCAVRLTEVFDGRFCFSHDRLP